MTPMRARTSHLATLLIGIGISVAALALGATSCKAGHEPTIGGAQEDALAAATVAHDAAAVRGLLAAGADPNKLVRYQDLYHAPWELALRAIRPQTRDTVEIVEAMLSAHADPAAAWGERVVRGYTRRYPDAPLMLAMSHPDADVVRAIMDAGLDPRLGENTLVDAAENGEIAIVHVLIEHGVNVNCHPGANTPLTAAIDARNVALMTYLEDHGAKEKP
jgi:ankyrin repeat protein